MTAPWLLADRATAWRDTITFIAPCPTCGQPALWRGHKTGGPIGATDTTYDAIDCPKCEGDWTVAAQAGRRQARTAAAELEEAA